MITDFQPGLDGGLQWRVVNDGVMGGLSEGNVAFTEAGELVFVGNLSLENNGGFSSIRSNKVSLDFSRAEGLARRVKGDGRTYQLRFSNRSACVPSSGRNCVDKPRNAASLRPHCLKRQLPDSRLSASPTRPRLR